MARLWSLKLQRIERLSMLRLPVMRYLQSSRHATGRFSGTHARVNFQGPAIISSAVRNVVAWQVSSGLSALRQPAHRNAAPKCHTPLPYWPPVLRQSANQSGSPSLFAPSPGGLPVLRRPALQIGSSQLLAPKAESLAIQANGSRAMHRPRKNEHGTAGLFATYVPCFSRQPNRSFNRDVNASHCRPLTLALGFSLKTVSAPSRGPH
jgi:hypothetical protein